MVAHQTLDLPPLPQLPALPAAAVASVAPPAPSRRRCRGRRWGRAPRLSRPWPDRDPRAPARFPAVPCACLSPPCAAFPVHDRARGVGTRAAVRHAKTETHVMQNTSFEFPAPWRAALAAIFLPPRPAGARLDMDPVVITAVAPDSPLTFITNPKTPRQPLPASDGTDYLKTIPGFSAIRNGGTNGDPVLRGMFGSRLNILTNGSSMPGACPGAWTRPAPISRPRPSTSSPSSRDRRPCWGPGASAGTVRFDRDTPRFTEAGVRFDGSLTGGSFGRNDQTADFTAGNESVYVRVTGNHCTRKTTRTATACACPRAGTSGTPTWPWASRRTPTRCSS